jgi:hypothetical protein
VNARQHLDKSGQQDRPPSGGLLGEALQFHRPIVNSTRIECCAGRAPRPETPSPLTRSADRPDRLAITPAAPVAPRTSFSPTLPHVIITPGPFCPNSITASPHTTPPQPSMRLLRNLLTGISKRRYAKVHDVQVKFVQEKDARATMEKNGKLRSSRFEWG